MNFGRYPDHTKGLYAPKSAWYRNGYLPQVQCIDLVGLDAATVPYFGPSESSPINKYRSIYYKVAHGNAVDLEKVGKRIGNPGCSTGQYDLWPYEPDSHKIDPEDKATWPAAERKLTDLQLGWLLALNIPRSTLRERYPFDFDIHGRITLTRPPLGFPFLVWVVNAGLEHEYGGSLFYGLADHTNLLVGDYGASIREHFRYRVPDGVGQRLGVYWAHGVEREMNAEAMKVGDKGWVFHGRGENPCYRASDPAPLQRGEGADGPPRQALELDAGSDILIAEVSHGVVLPWRLDTDHLVGTLTKRISVYGSSGCGPQIMREGLETVLFMVIIGSLTKTIGVHPGFTHRRTRLLIAHLLKI